MPTTSTSPPRGTYATAIRRIDYIRKHANGEPPPGWPKIVLEATLAGHDLFGTIKAFGHFCRQRQRDYAACHLYLEASR